MAERGRRVLLACSLSWGLAVTAPLQAGEVSVDVSRWPYTAIGKLNVVTGPGSRQFCTATLIGPRLALTAAHCLWDKARARWVEPASIHFVAGYALGAYTAHSVGSAAHVPEGYDPTAPTVPGNLMQDRALLELADTIHVKPVELDDGPQEQTVQDIGWAGYRRDRNQVMTAEADCAGKLTNGGRLMRVPGCRAVFGESGSAVFRDLATRPRITAVLVATATGTDAIAVPVASFLAEAREILARQGRTSEIPATPKGKDLPSPRAAKGGP